MAGKKLSDLPWFEGKELALEVQQRGVKALGDRINQANDLMLIGLVQVVQELLERVDALERQMEGEA